MEMKNCSTARKIIGVLERQQCGYWWRYSSTPKRLLPVSYTHLERVFPLHTPRIAKIEVVNRGKVRRAKLHLSLIHI